MKNLASCTVALVTILRHGEDGVLLLGKVVGLAVDHDPVRMMHVAAYLLPIRHWHLEALTRWQCNDRDAVLSRCEIDVI